MEYGPIPHVGPNKTQNEDVSAQQLARQPNKVNKLLTELGWVLKVAYLTSFKQIRSFVSAKPIFDVD